MLALDAALERLHLRRRRGRRGLRRRRSSRRVVAAIRPRRPRRRRTRRRTDGGPDPGADRRSARPSRRSRSRRGTARSDSTSCSSAPTAGRRPQHRHAHHGLDRPGDQAGRDVQPAARHDRRPGPARAAARLWGSVYGQKINSFYINNRNRSDVWPGGKAVRGYNALKATLGELYGLDIKYFVEVDFDGFRDVVDALGGVTVNVQVPIVDDTYPAGDRRDRRLYVPSGLQHMTGQRGAPLRPLAPHDRTTSIAPHASSGCCCRFASRPTRSSSSRGCRSSSRPSRRPSRRTSRSTSSTSCSGWPPRSTRRTSRSYVFQPPPVRERDACRARRSTRRSPT